MFDGWHRAKTFTWESTTLEITTREIKVYLTSVIMEQQPQNQTTWCCASTTSYITSRKICTVGNTQSPGPRGKPKKQSSPREIFHRISTTPTSDPTSKTIIHHNPRYKIHPFISDINPFRISPPGALTPDTDIQPHSLRSNPRPLRHATTFHPHTSSRFHNPTTRSSTQTTWDYYPDTSRNPKTSTRTQASKS